MKILLKSKRMAYFFERFKYLLTLGNGFAGSENMAESRFAAALPIIILLSNVEVAILNNIQNFHLPPRCF
jgi:hypothetical protein